MLSVLHNDVKVTIMAALSFPILLFLQEFTQISLISHKIIFEDFARKLPDIDEEPICIPLFHPSRSQDRFLGVCRYCCFLHPVPNDAPLCITPAGQRPT